MQEADGGRSSPRRKGCRTSAKSPAPTRAAAPAAISENGEIAYATVQYDVFANEIEKEDTKRLIDAAEAASGDGLQVELGGQPIEEARQEEEGDASFLIGLLAAVVVLLLTFGSLVAMGLPILTALFALGVGLSLITLGTHVFDTAEFAPQLALMIGLGVGIDYALFILTRFRNGLDEGMDKRDAAIAAVDTAGRAVLFAGVTVIIALMGMFLLGLSFLYGVAMSAAIAVLMTMIAALTLLPALLTIAGHWVDRLHAPRPRQTRAVDRPRTPAGSAGAARSSAGRWPRRCSPAACCSCSASPPSRCASAPTTPAPTRPGRRPARPTTCSPKASGPGFNGPFSIVAALPGKGDDTALTELRQDPRGRRRASPGRPR